MDMPKDIIKDTKTYLDVEFPEKKGLWTHEVIRPEYSFQGKYSKRDCGFHICNYALAAITDRKIFTKENNEFTTFKNDIEKEIEKATRNRFE
jgi:hypothetical protein